MYIMALIVGHNGPSRFATTIANRTPQSGGSLGGNKKAGIFGGSVSFPRGNLPASVFYRAPQRTPTLAQMKFYSTRSPLQLRRGSYAVTHSGMLG